MNEYATHTPGTKVRALAADALGVAILISDSDGIDESLKDNAAVMVRTARALLDADEPMGSAELRYLARALTVSLVDLLEILGVDTDD